MISLPIVQRELLVGSRKRLTFWSRSIAAFIGFLAVFFIVGGAPDAATAGALGVRLFRWLSATAFWICLFGGALLTADCLSVEKREGTLGLLFLTDLKGYDVAFGKLAAKSLAALYCLIAILPMLALPILLGGVSGGDFWRVVLALLNTAFLSLSVGMLSSVLCRDSRNAYACGEFLLFLLLVLPPIAHGLIGPSGPWVSAMFSPVESFFMASFGRVGPNSVFYFSQFVLHLLAWLCLIIAGRRVQTSWQEQGGKGPLLDRWRELLRGKPAKRLALRRLLLPINPILWLESRDWVVRVALLWLFLLLAGFCGLLNSNRYFHWSDLGDSVWTIVLLHLLVKLLIAFDASGRMVDAKRDGALTMVLSTRISPADLLRGEFQAIKRRFGWPLLIIITFDLVWLVNSLRFHNRHGILVPLTLAGCLIAVLISNCCALVWTGLASSMRSKRHYRAAWRAYGAIVIAPMLLFGLMATGLSRAWGVAGSSVTFTIVSLLNAWLFGTLARERFQSDLRQILTEAPRPPEKDLNEDYALLK